MRADDSNERAYARMVRASGVFASRGARRHADNARAWVRAEGYEAHLKARDARALSEYNERCARERARRGKRARITAPPRASTPVEMRARALGTRALRSLCALAIPCALIAYPPYALFHGDPLALLIWPLAYGYLVWDGWLYRDKPEAVEEVKPKAGSTAAPVSETPAPTVLAPSNNMTPTAEESAVINRIETWGAHAAERKLSDVVPAHPVIDESGLLIPVSFTGQGTPAKLDAQLDQVRALLAVPDEVRTQVKPGGFADRALLRVRTRTRDLDLTWTPEREGFGLDADTGEVVEVDVTDRILDAGMSGAGKSVGLRVLMAEALKKPNTALVIIDLKVEGALWSHVARVESEPEDIEALVRELTEEMKERETIMRARGMDMWEATPERPVITVVVDEGAELLAEVHPDCIAGLRSLARRARSAGLPLWWATQKPTVTGKGAGLDSSISMQLTTQICFAVPTPNEARNVFGDDATANGWHPETMQKGGWALVRVQGGNRAPDPVRVWHMTKEHVKALAPRPAWRRTATRPADAQQDILSVALELSEGLQGVSTGTLAAKLDIQDVEVHARMRVYGLAPEPHAFAMGNGVKARGYRRSALETARDQR